MSHFLGSRKFVVFLVITFLTVYGAVSGAISVQDAVEYVVAAGAVYTAVEGAGDIAERAAAARKAD